MNLEEVSKILNNEKVTKEILGLKNSQVRAKFPSIGMICDLLLEFVTPEMFDEKYSHNAANKVVPLGIEKSVIKLNIIGDNGFIINRNDFLLNKRLPKMNLIMSRFNDKCYITANEMINDNIVESYYLFNYDDEGNLKSFEACENGEKEELYFDEKEA